MSLHLTPEIIEAQYELLRLTPPFARWKLPHADGLEFKVLVTTERCGHFRESDDGVHEIAISIGRVRTLADLATTLAHEMVHLRQCQQKHRDNHGATFNRLADQVCKHHGFNREDF